MRVLATSTCFESPQHGMFSFYKWFFHFIDKIPNVDQVWAFNDGPGPFNDPGFAKLPGFRLFTFPTRLGRQGLYEMPGIKRSIYEAYNQALINHVDELIYIETDSLLVGNSDWFSDNIEEYLAISRCTRLVSTFYSKHYQMPDANFQFASGPYTIEQAGLRMYAANWHDPAEQISTKESSVELLAGVWNPMLEDAYTTPGGDFLSVTGDRYFEFQGSVPAEAHYVSNAPFNAFGPLATRFSDFNVVPRFESGGV